MRTPILGIWASQISGHLTLPASFEAISSVSGNNSATSLTISSIPSTYKSLHLRILFVPSSGDSFAFQVNGDTTSGNYWYHRLYGDGTTLYASGAATSSYIFPAFNVNATTTYPAVATLDIQDYASTAKYKTFRIFNGLNNDSVGSIAVNSGTWKSTSAINSITILSNNGLAINSATTMALYGIN